MSSKKPLTPEQQRFVDEYLVDPNGTKAYHVAYPNAPLTSCPGLASRLLRNVKVKAEIQAARKAQQNRTHIRADHALLEAARIAFFDPLHLFGPDGRTLRNIREIPFDTRRAIAGVKVRKEKTERRITTSGVTTVETETTSEVVEYKIVPKSVGLDKLFGYLGLNQELPPLDKLLASLPPQFARVVREALAKAVGVSDGAPEGAKNTVG